MKKWLATLIYVMLFLSCSKKGDLEISGGPYRLDLQSGDSIGYIDIGITSGTELDKINVSVNGIQMPSATDASVQYYFKLDSIPQPTMVYSASIQTNIETATACCTLPGNFSITAPVDGITIDTSLIIAWDLAAHADRYDVYTEMVYFDTVNNLITKDTVISTNSDHITLGQFWFGDLAGQGDLIIKVFAVNGAGALSDTNSNVTGSTGNWSAMHGRHKKVDVYKQ